MQRCQRPEFVRDPLRRWRRHDHAVGRVAWSWRAEPVWVMAPRVRPAMQARRVRVSSPMAARQGRVRVPVKALDIFYHFTNNLCFIGVAGSWMLIVLSVA